MHVVQAHPLIEDFKLLFLVQELPLWSVGITTRSSRHPSAAVNPLHLIFQPHTQSQYRHWLESCPPFFPLLLINQIVKSFTPLWRPTEALPALSLGSSSACTWPFVPNCTKVRRSWVTHGRRRGLFTNKTQPRIRENYIVMGERSDLVLPRINETAMHKPVK